MLNLTYTYHLYDRDHIRPIRQAITAHLVDHPLFIFPMGKHAQLRFDTNEEGYFIEEQIANTFTDYEFITDLTNGNEDILLSIVRSQSPTSSDNWGRGWNEETIISEKHLVKKRERSVLPVPNSKFYVFFGEEIQEYQVHLGVYDKGTSDEAFVILDRPFDNNSNAKTISDAIKNKTDAIWEGIRLLGPKIETEFAAYREALKKSRSRKKRDA